MLGLSVIILFNLIFNVNSNLAESSDIDMLVFLLDDISPAAAAASLTTTAAAAAQLSVGS